MSISRSLSLFLLYIAPPVFSIVLCRWNDTMYLVLRIINANRTLSSLLSRYLDPNLSLVSCQKAHLASAARELLKKSRGISSRGTSHHPSDGRKHIIISLTILPGAAVTIASSDVTVYLRSRLRESLSPFYRTLRCVAGVTRLEMLPRLECVCFVARCVVA